MQEFSYRTLQDSGTRPRHCRPRKGSMTMQFHHHGYVSGDPRILPAAGTGLDRPADLPDEIDVLIVGSGPAGMLLAAQMSQYPIGHDAHRRAAARPARHRPGRRHPGAQRRDVPGLRLRRAHRRRGVPPHRDELLDPRRRRPLEDRPHLPRRRRPARRERVPAPDREPGTRARLLRRGRRERARAHHPRLRLAVRHPRSRRRGRVPGRA